MEFRELEKVLLRVADKVVVAMLSILASKGKSGTDLYNSFKTFVKKTTQGIILTISMKGSGKWVDSGRRPGKMPPEEPIKDWVSKKGLPEKAVFPIRKNIGLKGIPATNFMDPWRKFSSGNYKNDLEKALGDDIKLKIKNDFKNNK